ncbi:MAG TPA: tetratricopeptide repeat protein [Sedimentisphaerales bacterium]|nr:tetratricopeptide repeat protein [Sedimentisphaerales bacterium]
MPKQHSGEDRPKAESPAGAGRQAVLAAVLLAAATVFIYLPVGRHEFVHYDDDVYITGNWHVRQGLSWQTFAWAFTNTSHANNWHPLTWLSHMADTEIFGPGPAGPHHVNVALHTLNALLLFGFLFTATRRVWAAAIVAAFFALHPLRVESVAWAAQRKDVLSAFFWLAAMWAWMHYCRRPGAARYVLVTALFVLGIMAKPMIVTLPVALLLLDYWPLQRFEFTRRFWRRELKFSSPDATALGLLLEKMPLLVLSAISCVVTVIAQGHAVAALGAMDVPTRLTNAVVSYGRYIGAALWPAGLAVFYPHPRQPLYWAAAAVAAALLVITVLVLRASRSHKFLLTGWLWYLITLVPVIGLVQVGGQSHADRYTYIPVVGLSMAGVWLAAQFVSRRPALKTVSAVIVIAVLCAISFITIRTLSYWKNSEMLFRRAVAVTTDNHVMKANLAIWLATQNQIEEARKYAEESLSLRPTEAALALMGGLAARDGRFEEALNWFTQAMSTGSRMKELNFNMGSMLMSLDRPEEAVPYLRRATELDPWWYEAFWLLGTALIYTGETQEATEAIKRSLELEPGRVKICFGSQIASDQSETPELTLDSAYAQLSNTAGLLAKDGRLREAENYCRVAIKLKPHAVYAYYNLALVLAAQGRKEEAIEVLQEVERIRPGEPETRRQLELLTESKQ